MTEPDDVEKTLFNITQFDDRPFGFSHERTWSALAVALKGIFEPKAVGASMSNVPVRVQRCITALCELGKELRLDTRAFADYPGSGLRTVTPIAWDPEITVRVKGSCWYVQDGRARIPLLQPRKASLSEERMSVYLRLGKQAFCQGDWVDADVALVDLAGEDDDGRVQARIIEEHEIRPASDAVLMRYVKTFVEAKKAADLMRAERPKEKTIRLPIDELFNLKSQPKAS